MSNFPFEGDLGKFARGRTLLRLSYLLYTSFYAPKSFKACEVGVSAGDNAIEMLKCPLLGELVLVDPYLPNDKNFTYDVGRAYSTESADEFYKGVKFRMSKYDNVRLFREPSAEAAKRFQNEYFDYIYIDAIHDTEHVLEDLNAWWDKLKVNGVMAGHDSISNEVAGGVIMFAQKMKVSATVTSVVDCGGFMLPYTEWIDWWIIKS